MIGPVARCGLDSRQSPLPVGPSLEALLTRLESCEGRGDRLRGSESGIQGYLRLVRTLALPSLLSRLPGLVIDHDLAVADAVHPVNPQRQLELVHLDGGFLFNLHDRRRLRLDRLDPM